MAIGLDLALFEEELDAVRSLEVAARWQLERDHSAPLGLFVVMHSANDPGQLYKARLRWEDYFAPPSLKYINMLNGSDSDPTAWPRCAGFRPGSLDSCIPLTAEGHKTHPEWCRSAVTRYPVVEVPMQYALMQLQIILDNSYNGRGP